MKMIYYIKKYCDNDLNLDQFEQAKQKIHTENEKRRKQIPKPTHHIVVPMYEDIKLPINNETKNDKVEQKMLDSLMTYILDNENSDILHENNSQFKYNYIIEFCKFYKQMYSSKSSKNNNVYREIFNDNDYHFEGENTRDIFQKWKAYCEIIFLKKII